ncbi:nitronate monooxygenase family protein [Proteinivorax tanatarense]|uniref:Probable nitronate monooxygenase n=1 Tax=Proteinivorax tanatarense TaxID=1260629 RepID=A0AAU7VJE6_9FIRM
MKLAPLKIGNLQSKLPIIQGGMGIGVSLSKLAAAVANEGGIGTISGVQIGFKDPEFETDSEKANIKALKNEIAKAKELAPEGIIAVNLMVALSNYDDMVKAAVDGGADIIVSGAGIPSRLPELVQGRKCKLIPIVSSGKAAKIICKRWKSRYNYLPDGIIVEGPDAGGHLGFSMDQLIEGGNKDLETIVKETIEIVRPFEEEDKKIPIIAAGGIFDGSDIAKFLQLGASGVQMGTRFIATEECDASKAYKNEFINCKKGDIQLTQSPVGMPGRAIRNKFLSKISDERKNISKCYNCLSKCNPATTLYCISEALLNAVKGNTKEGLIFTGTNGYKIEKIVSVKELMQHLKREVGEGM